MHFTTLLLTGFKSFVEPTELQIGPGMTGIVGPNGCGKSNIVEALRWVMGETSAKKMRGSEMDDVIFGGSTTRPARNNAQVTLSLDNSDRGAPARFNEADSIEISRRIERGSGSQYQINGNDVRARDIQLLFADLASGAQSTAMVSQGRVGALIGAKPAERRLLLEEAAGITGLHSRRHEVELRLKGAETNLERLDDVIGALRDQRHGLTRQARQAQRYRKISDQIKNKEALLLHLCWTEATNVKEASVAKLRDLEKRVSKQTHEAAIALNRRVKAQEALPALRDSAVRAAAELQRIKMAVRALENEESRLSETESEITLRLKQIKGDINRETTLAKEAAETIKRLEEEGYRLQNDKITAERAIATSKDALLEAQGALVSKESNLAKITEEVAVAEAKKTAITARAQELEERRLRLEARVNQIDSERGILREKFEADQRLAKTERELANSESRLAEARIALQQTEKDRAEAEEKENILRSKTAEEHSSHSEITAEIKALLEIVGEPDNDLFPPLIDALDVSTGYETALAAALGEDLTAPIDEAADRHWASLGPLERSAALPEGTKPLSEFVKGPAALRRRLSNIGLVPDNTDGSILREQLRPGQWLVSKNGNFWRWDGFTVAAGAPSAAATKLSQRNRLEELEELLKTAEISLTAADKTHKASIKKLSDAIDKEKETRQTVETLLERLDGARGTRANLLSESSGVASRLKALEEALEESEQELTKTQNLEAEVADALKAVSIPLQLRSSLDNLRQTVSDHKKRESDCLIKFNQLDSQAQSRRERLNAIEKELISWRERTSGTTQQLNDLIGRQTDIQNQAKTLSKKPSEIAAKRQKLIELTKQSEEAQAEASDLLVKGESEQNDADRRSKIAETELGKFREEMVRQQGFVEQATQDCRVVVERIKEKLGCPPESAIHKAGHASTLNLPTMETLEADIAKLLRTRDAIGPVNLRAESELEDIGERIEAMENEREDLLSAIARLRQGVLSLNREGRERLLTAFDEVKTHFEDLFVRLFGGGRAFIQLTESEDPLEAGLEIMASPPGKKLQVMSLLSGGEQALTALALLFAVFLTNPAPICVLDEVDAPLDDSNVDRFCTMLEEIACSGKTRFLCVTHHRMTMARMDRLFGVTMGERGVSQLVSVDLGAAEEIRNTA